MLFIYWGWDTAVSVNEETADKARTPSQVGPIVEQVLLLFTYAIVIIAVQSFAGVSGKGARAGEPGSPVRHNDSVTGSAILPELPGSARCYLGCSS